MTVLLWMTLCPFVIAVLFRLTESPNARVWSLAFYNGFLGGLGYIVYQINPLYLADLLGIDTKNVIYTGTGLVALYLAIGGVFSILTYLAYCSMVVKKINRDYVLGSGAQDDRFILGQCTRDHPNQSRLLWDIGSTTQSEQDTWKKYCYILNDKLLYHVREFNSPEVELEYSITHSYEFVAKINELVLKYNKLITNDEYEQQTKEGELETIRLEILALLKSKVSTVLPPPPKVIWYALVFSVLAWPVEIFFLLLPTTRILAIVNPINIVRRPMAWMGTNVFKEVLEPGETRENKPNRCDHSHYL